MAAPLMGRSSWDRCRRDRLVRWLQACDVLRIDLLTDDDELVGIDLGVASPDDVARGVQSQRPGRRRQLCSSLTVLPWFDLGDRLVVAGVGVGQTERHDDGHLAQVGLSCRLRR